MALALFASLVAPEALCTDRRTGMLDLYLAGPLDVKRYLAAKWAAVASRDARDDGRPAALHPRRRTRSRTPGRRSARRRSCCCRIVVSGIGVALFYTALSMGVSSLTTRRAVAAVATVLVLLVPSIAVGVADREQRRTRRARAAHSRRRDRVRLAGVRRRPAARPTAIPRSPTSPPGSSSQGSPAGSCSGRPSASSATGARAGDDERAARRRGVIEVRGVSKWFGSLVAVSDVSFDVGPGVTALLGPNGAGKSTMLRMLCGLARPSKGTVRILGSDPRSRRRRHAAGRPRAAAGDRVRAADGARVRAARRRSLHDLPDPDGAARAALETVELDPRDERRLPTYSKGMRQRVKLAQAIVHDPRVIVLDEPLTGLDPRQRAHMIELFHRLGAEGRCVVVVEPRARRGGALRVGRPRDGEGQARRVRRLPRDPGPDGRPPATHPRSRRARRGSSRGDLLHAGVVVGAQRRRRRRPACSTPTTRGASRRAIAPLARARGATVLEVRPVDEDLEDVFRYLVER